MNNYSDTYNTFYQSNAASIRYFINQYYRG